MMPATVFLRWRGSAQHQSQLIMCLHGVNSGRSRGGHARQDQVREQEEQRLGCPLLKPGQQKETKKWGDGEIGAEGELKWPTGRSEPGPMSPGWTYRSWDPGPGGLGGAG